ncbi:hypothetical protein AXF42_Ash008777 [Apostasia shenzhenica]|uniref:RIN4 pathogenic type III effector avirulence factor Avr cleavage site domain-containing protein n=1 Tax=Apostasia shenzhenica TaxID=1088818 RepID=A0A2I0ASG7_9ASPA|nr:hypothetical protein AXF42_Ash008777 [Apostasia shenzhenica]
MAFDPAKTYLKKRDGWMAVPQFGGWDQKTGGSPDYTMVFSRARANRKNNQKINVSRPSTLGHEKEFLNFPLPRSEDDCVVQKKKKATFFRCLSCSVEN